MREKRLVVDDVPEPSPAAGQVLVRTLACGICGSDLHALQHGELMVEMSEQAGAANPDDLMRPQMMDLSRDVVMGHEFAAEVIELGANVGNAAVGDVVVSMPITFDANGVYPIGYSNEYPGGYGELMALSDMLVLKVPNGLDPHHAALTEPMAVGVHAVNRSKIAPGEAAVVLGCGPVGLAVIADLRRKGIEPIVAADFSPTRRLLATAMGAHEVVDPRDEPAVDAWRRIDPQRASRTLVLFEAVGVPGMLDSAIAAAPRNARILVVGVCMQPDTIRPMLAIGRELQIQFALGYDPMEFAATLQAIADGELAVDALITGRVGIDDVPGAFRALADPDAHAKVLVVPGVQ
jgi:2-desacetyl-2-hydroxyethyl bacteriochlorophyllide A dehydrogenase